MCDEEFADDIDKAVFPGGQGGPLMHNIAGKAVGFKEALDPSFDEYAQNVVDNAEVLAETLQDHGFSLVSGGTDNHLVLVDLRDSHPDLPGGDAADALAAANIVLNGNTVPGETRSPFNPSGIRVGTAGVTTRGFDADVMEEVGDLIHRVVDNVDSDDVIYDGSASASSSCATSTRCTSEFAAVGGVDGFVAAGRFRPTDRIRTYKVGDSDELIWLTRRSSQHASTATPYPSRSAT